MPGYHVIYKFIKIFQRLPSSCLDTLVLWLNLRNSYSVHNLELYIILGAYGTVYKARDTINDSIVAIKKVKLGLTEDGVPMQVLFFTFFKIWILTIFYIFYIFLKLNFNNILYFLHFFNLNFNIIQLIRYWMQIFWQFYIFCNPFFPCPCILFVHRVRQILDFLYLLEVLF